MPIQTGDGYNVQPTMMRRLGVAVGVLALSGLISVTPAEASTAVPGAPTSVTATPSSASSAIEVTWVPASAGPSADAFEVEVFNSSGSLGTVVCFSCTSQLVQGLDPGVAYGFDVMGYNSSGTGPGTFSSAVVSHQACSTAPVCVNVDANSVGGLAQRRASGFLEANISTSGTVTDPSLLSALGVTNWRGDTDYQDSSKSFSTAEQYLSGAKLTEVISDDWYQDNYDPSLGGPPTPWSNWSAYSSFVSQLVSYDQAHGLTPDYWEVQNEPGTGYYPPSEASSWTVANQLAQYKVAYQAIKAVDPTAKVIGPSVGTFYPAHAQGQTTSYLDLETFLQFAQANNVVPDAVAWHEIGDSPAVGNLDIQPYNIVRHVDQARAVMAGLGLGNIPILINEYQNRLDNQIPGWTVGNIAAIEQADVFGGRACYDDTYNGTAYNQCGVPGFDGLFAPDGQTPLANYWVYLAYAQATGRVVASSTTNAKVSAFATRDDSTGTIHVLIGRHETCAGASYGPCSSVTPPNPEPLTLNIALPGGSGPYSVSVKDIPNQRGAMPNGAVAVSGTASSMTSDGHLLVTIPSVADGDAYVVTAAAIPATSPGRYFPVQPSRITDTRPGSGQANAGSTLGPGGTLDVAVAGQGGVPATGASAALVNVTAVTPTSPGYLSVYPSGQARPLASSLNFGSGQTISNLVEVPLSSTGHISVFNLAGYTDVVIDVEGYVSGASGGAGYEPIFPTRLTDTRAGSGMPNAGATLGPGTSLGVQISGAGPIPASGVSAVALNVTAVDSSQGGYLSVYPSASARPLASNVNFTAGQVIPNRVIVPVGPNGRVEVFNADGLTDVVVDAVGYYTTTTTTSGTGGQLHPLTPTRIADTRPGSGQANAGQTLAPNQMEGVQVAGVGGVPSTGVTAVMANVTATDTTASGYLTVVPGGSSEPVVSDLNFSPGTTISNLVLVELGPNGTVGIYNSTGRTDVVVDVLGWFS
ncbi:MAG: fibronectin type III domain-containing protein [Acidimicrobiales bacterium]